MAEDWRHRYRNEKKKQIQQEFDGWTTTQFIYHLVELRETVIELEARLEEKSLPELEKEVKHSLTDRDYKQEWSYPTKVVFILTIAMKPMKSKELDQALNRLDKQYHYYEDPFKNLTVTLNRAVKSGRIKKIKMPGIQTLYYALPEWVNKEGEINSKFSLHLNQFV